MKALKTLLIFFLVIYVILAVILDLCGVKEAPAVALCMMPIVIIAFFLIASKNHGKDSDYDQERKKEVKSRMLYVMQHGHYDGANGALKEFNEIFHKYPEWRLVDWIVFRSWYKHEIDFLLLYPKVFEMKMEDGSPYSKEADPLYDPDAVPWERFDKESNYVLGDEEKEDFFANSQNDDELEDDFYELDDDLDDIDDELDDDLDEADCDTRFSDSVYDADMYEGGDSSAGDSDGECSDGGRC